jgi:uncharacterized membrane protein
VTGIKTYKITYRVSGGLAYFKDYDELYWNITGNEWDIPITTASTTVTLPQKVNTQSISTVCYTGLLGSQATDCSIESSGNNVRIRGNNILESGEGLTIAVKFEKGVVQQLLPREASFIDVFPSYIFFIVFVLLIVILIGYNIIFPIKMLIDWLTEKNFIDRNKRVVAAWFEPPKTKEGTRLPPALTSAIRSRKAGLQEMTGTLIDLATRGYIKIDASNKKKIKFTEGNITGTEELFDYEKKILGSVLKNDLNDLTINDFSNNVIKQLGKIGIFDKDPYKTSNTYTIIGSLSMVFFGFLAGLAALLIGRKNWKMNLDGVQSLSETISLNNFLTSQTDQLNFQSKNQMFFEKLLPYASAFGVEKVWAEKFNDIPMQKPEWYEGDFVNAGSLYTLDRSLSSNIRSINYQNSGYSSSGFSSGSSGGSSGGGGGGGGGGSW